MHFFSSPTFLTRFLFFCFLTFSACAFSQEKDSLSHYSYEELTLKLRGIIYKDGDVAKLYAEKILEIATQERNDERIVNALLHLANTSNLMRKPDLALTYIDRAISIVEKEFKGKELEAKVISTKGILCYQNSNYEEAFKHYTIAYNFYKNTDNSIETNGLSYNIALIKNILGDHKGALQMLQKNYNDYVNSSQSNKDEKFSRNFHANTLLTISDVYIKLSTQNLEEKTTLLDSASTYIELGFAETNRIQDVLGNIYLATGKGIVSYERGKHEQAIEELDRSIKRIHQSNYKTLFTSAYYYKAMSLKNLQQIDSAIVYFQKTDSISQKNNTNYPMLQSAYYHLATIFKKRKDKVNAYKYLEMYIENDRINERLTGTVRKDIHEKYDLKRLEREIDDLNDKRSKSTIIISLLVISLCVFFFLHKKQRRKNKIAFEKLLRQLDEKNQFEIIVSKPSKVVTIDDEKVLQVLKALEKFEQKELYRNKNCDLTFVAKKAKTNKTYLSKIIHTHKDLKFIDYIRNLRIDYALKRLKDDSVFRSYDIKSIAEESGFKSSDLFSRAFVKNTGIYPSYYIKNINRIER